MHNNECMRARLCAAVCCDVLRGDKLICDVTSLLHYLYAIYIHRVQTHKQGMKQ